jgi:hypothetical protein
VADLIDQQTASWKINLINQLYDKTESDQIMSITILVVETNAAPDKLIWPHSLNGDYQVKKAYEILTHNDNVSEPPSPNNTHPTMWKHLWKIKLPQKILTFTWKILNHALPVKVELNRRGVHCNRDCLMCNNAIETQDHLFLHCELARAVWFGAGIPILHITQAEITVDIWVKNLLKQHTTVDNDYYNLKRILTLLWCIWFHRNQTIFEGKQPNPLEIILTSNSLLNRFLQNYSNNAGNTGRAGHTAKIATWTPDSNWQALITIAAGAITTSTRYGIAYMGKRRNGQVIFVGCKTTGSQDSKIARLLAIRESILTATKLGFQRLIIFTEDREIEHMWDRNHLYRWKLSTIFQDIKNLQHQHHLSLTIKATPMAVIKETKSMALTASRTFLNVYHEHSMFGPYAFK